MNTETTIAEGARLLEAAGIENGRQEARWLMSQLMCEIPPCSVPCPADLPEWLLEEYDRRLRRRVGGEPLQYIMGSAEFYNVELLVGPGVLIPRPETEQLVEIALTLAENALTLAENGEAQDSSVAAHSCAVGGSVAAHSCAVCDLCTGSGAIALAIAKALPGATVTGIDISAAALAYAQKNKERLALANVSFLHGDLFAPLPAGSRFGLITANPPYVSEGDYAALEPVVRDYEPALALLGGKDGLDVLRRIAATARDYLLPGGVFISEIGDEQGLAAKQLFEENGFKKVEIRRDYSGKERFAIAVNN
ncbi:MAG: peptide chain release factor N(5)-glutamine methyltransferase [Victivallales bacterium]|nr:peptide chain release factor N(5)-glutamine methyltransferase [Victivallales bacterium]